MAFVGVQWRLLAFVAFAITLQWRLLAFSGVCWRSVAFVGVCGICYYTSVAFVGVRWRLLAFSRGLAAMRPACHLDTQNTVFWQFGHPKVCWRSVAFVGVQQWLSRNASSVSFGHAEHFFGSLDNQRFMSEFAEDDFSKKIEDVEAVVSLL